MQRRGYYGHIALLWLLQAIGVACVQDQPLFWDNVLLSGKIPTELYVGRLSSLFVSERLAGYSPLWGAYIAIGWHWLGRSLAATHWLMLPLLWLISFQMVRLAQQFVPRRALGLTLMALLSVPVLAALSVQCGPDLAMVGFYLAALNAILYRNRGWLVLVLVVLALVSPRGLWCLVPLFVIDQALVGNKLFSPRWQWALGKAFAFAPAGLAAAGWYYLQYDHYGWLFADPDGDFASLAAYTTLPEYLRQLGICAWRMIDFGQLAVWLPLAGLAIAALRGRAEHVELRGTLALLTLAPAVAFALFFAAFRNPVGHRYMLLPVLFATLWLCYEWAEGLRYARFSRRVWMLVAVFWTGHLWVALYPQSWAKGWDATLLHVQAGAAKRAMAAELVALPAEAKSQVGAHFPDADAWEDCFLADWHFAPAPYDPTMNAYLLYSNAGNAFEPADVAYLSTYTRPAVVCRYWPVRMELRRNPRVPLKGTIQ